MMSMKEPPKMLLRSHERAEQGQTDKQDLTYRLPSGIQHQEAYQQGCLSESVKRRVQDAAKPAGLISLACQGTIEHIEKSGNEHYKAGRKWAANADKYGGGDG